MSVPASSHARGKERRSLDWILAVVLILLAGAAWWGGFSLGFVHGNDAYDYAQMGHEIAAGRGFSTRQIFPRHVPFFAEHGFLEATDWPNLHRYPLPTIVDAFGEFVTGDVLVGAVVACGFAYLLSVPVLFALARRFAPRALAFAVALLFLADGPVRLSSYNGYTEALAMLLMLAALLVVFQEHLTATHCLVAGVLCGLAVLNRFQAALLLPLVAGFVYLRSPPGDALRGLAVLGAAAIVVTLPWALRDIGVVGRPFFSLSSTRSLLKGFGWDADMQLHTPVDLGGVLAVHGDALVRKCARCLGDKLTSLDEWVKLLRGWPYVVVLGVAVGSLFWGIRARTDVELFKRGALLFVAANVALQCLSVDHSRLYVPLRPLLLLVAVVGVVQLVDRIAAPARAATVRSVLAVLLLGSGAYAYASDTLGGHSPVGGSRHARRIAAKMRELCYFLEPDAIVVSDVSARITIYCGNKTIRLPDPPADLLTIDRDYLRVDYVFLSPSVMKDVSVPGRRAVRDGVDASLLSSAEFRKRFRRVPGTPGRSALFMRR